MSWLGRVGGCAESLEARDGLKDDVDGDLNDDRNEGVVTR